MAAAIAAALVMFMAIGTYTKRVTVAGQLLPETGIIKVHAPQSGVIVEARVAEGQRVERGDLLFVLSSERRSVIGETQAQISRQAQIRAGSLRSQLATTHTMEALERQTSTRSVQALHAEVAQFATLIEGQRRRVDLAISLQARTQSLRSQGYVSEDQLIQTQQQLLDEQARLQTLNKDLITSRRNLVDAQGQLSMLPLKYASQIEELQRQIATVADDLSESEAKRRLEVVAPASGNVTAIVIQVGQLVDPGVPVASIVPAGTPLQANLFAPTHAIGFVKVGQQVRLRYRAFPYERFGQYAGTVTAIATTALSSAELTGTHVFTSVTTNPDEPLYRISVTLDKQLVTAYGQQAPLQSGMLLDADLLRETRRLYEWVLEPLYSWTGKL